MLDDSRTGCQDADISESSENPPKDASAFPPDPIPNILPGGGINILCGAPGVGKGAFLAGFVTTLLTQPTVFGHPVGTISAIALLSADRSWQQDTRLWFTAAGCPPLPSYSYQDDTHFRKNRFRDKRHRIALFQEGLSHLDPLPPNSLVVVDTLTPFLGGDINNYDTCMVACMELREICRARQLTILGTTHTSKQRSSEKDRYLRLQDRLAGSVAQLGYTDTQMALVGPDELDAPYSIFQWTPHHAPSESFKLSRAKNGLFVSYDDGATTGVPVEQQVDLTDVDHEILKLIPLPPESIGFGELTIKAADHHHISKKIVFRSVNLLLQHGLVIKPRYGRYSQAKPS